MIRIKDPVSGGLHLLAAFVALVGLVFLVQKSLTLGDPLYLIAYMVFGLSMIALYLASAVHHLVPKGRMQAKRYRKIDHAMIFILIAGTYTPICLISLKGVFGWSLLAVVWTLAIFGVALKVSGRKVSRKFSTALYVGLGWAAVAAVLPIIDQITWTGFFWMLLGGIFYTVGAVIYALKRPDPFPKLFGFHEIFHLFVMAGTLSHFWVIFAYLD